MELRFADGARRRVFARPREVIVVRDASETSAALARLDEALSEGRSIAGILHYELGCRWNDLPTPAGTVELMRVGIYDGAAFEDVPSDPLADALLEPSFAGVTQADYAAALAAIARGLMAGDVYQVNYTVPFVSRCLANPRALFDTLSARARVPYAALVETEARAYVSLSPELFLAIDGDVVRTKPMKGTAPPDAAERLASDKNRAEHVMIVDLLRNDLHRICRDVRVEAFGTIERYPTFATMTSTIAGRLNGPLRLEALFAATFPCGSVTGAPKRSAMRSISELEAVPRGIAMGSIGYLEPQPGRGPRGWWNVAIRTLAIDRIAGTAELRVGGGIVADSTAVDEWREIWLKRRLFRDAERPVGLIETLRAENGAASPERHLARLFESAARLGIPYDAAVVRALLTPAIAACDAPTLLRLHLAPDGTPSLGARPLDPAPALAAVCVASRRLDERDPLLRFKTDRRAAYDAALAEARERGCFDAVLLNRAGDVADGARSSVLFPMPDGGLATPRLCDGALDGIARREALATGRAIEARIDGASLVAGSELHLANAARGWTRAVVTR